MSTSLSGGAQPYAGAQAAQNPAQLDALYRKLAWRIMPFLFLSLIHI